jgi:diguanylate cyclase (GGDEF)-like protein
MKQYLSDTSFKISIGFIVATMTLLLTLAYVLQGELRQKLERDSSKQVEANGNAIVAELVRQTSLIHSLAESLTAAVISIPYSDATYRQVLPNLINIDISSNLVAGGGIWPEPNALDPNKDKNSYFWGKNELGQLDFYNDYNLEGGKGYRNEEWYVPAKFLDKTCYWSRSYVDPFSKEPMVTCTLPIRKNGQYIGATTIDMKLEGLNTFFKQQSEKLGGYVFLVDQNNKFISFPQSKVRESEKELDENPEAERLHQISNIAELAATQPKFKQLAERLLNLSDRIYHTHPEFESQHQTMAAYFHDNSYQVTQEQAEIMASSILSHIDETLDNSYLLEYFQLNDDFLLQEKVNASIFHIPESYWKLVVVTPTSTDFTAVSNIIKETSKQLFIPIIITMSVFFFFIRYYFIRPLILISRHIRKYANNPEGETLIEGFKNGDFGRLATLYNIKTALVKKYLLEISRSNSQLQIYASYDDLTGTYNRRAFDNFIEELLRKDSRNEHAIFYLDLDQFKVVNDTAGHLAGDQLLIAISKRIATTLREGDILARIGGDEFAMIIQAPSIESSLAIAERIKHSISSYRFNWDDNTFTVSSSIGILHLSTLEGDKEKILSCVDSACYAAKEAGRNRNHLYLPEDSGLSERFGEMESLVTLRKALDDKRLFLEYQLIKHITGDSACGFEALVRMKGKDGKTIYPNSFMPAAERYNATWDVDQRVIDRAIAQFKAIKDNFDVGFCSINLTADALNHDQLLSTIKNALTKHDIDGSNFCFEITETNAIANVELASKIISQIRELGSRVSLDDFGTGMSSYSYLKALPVDYLKIDGAFVKNIEEDIVDHAFVKSITDIATAMNIQTVAEWVEHENIVFTLKDIGVDYAQGFGICKPMSFENLILNKEAIRLSIAKRFDR